MKKLSKNKARLRSDYVSLDGDDSPSCSSNPYTVTAFVILIVMVTVAILCVLTLGRHLEVEEGNDGSTAPPDENDAGTLSPVVNLLRLSGPGLSNWNDKSRRPTELLPLIDERHLSDAYLEAAEFMEHHCNNSGSADATPEETWPTATTSSKSFLLRSYQTRRVRPLPGSWNQSCSCEVQEKMAAIIKDRYGLNNTQISIGFQTTEMDLKVKECAAREAERVACRRDWPYRNHNGSCNNARHPLWGATNVAYVRLMPADYEDGISLPRRSKVDGSILPSPRNVTVEIHVKTAEQRHPLISQLWTFFGQFITHDVTKVASHHNMPNCCGPDRKNSSVCMPIEISEDDPFYGQRGVRCLPVWRSQPAPKSDCLPGSRDQVNVLTSYLDGSGIYGSDEETANQLRSFKNGQLKSFNSRQGSFLPIITERTSGCSMYKKPTACFQAGDTRCNENLMLTSLHTMWMREHNRVVDLLRAQNPSWDDERLYQEARRIVIAELQHVTYNEYLPLLIGRKAVWKFGLAPMSGGQYYDGYSPETDATVGNEFAAAAFRFGHGAVDDTFLLTDDNVTEHLRLHHGFFVPSYLMKANSTLGTVLYGASVQNALSVNPHVTDEFTNHLFESESDTFGLDLVSIHIQRGRDHGIPAYNDVRVGCGLPRLESFHELESVMVPDTARRYAAVYKSVDDLDLYSAGLAEHHLPGAQVGPTFGCVIVDQFARTRNGDRYWYENGPRSHPKPFTRPQLRAIRDVTIARLLCDNVINVRHVPRSGFRVHSEKNRPVPCVGQGIPKLNLKYWRE